MKKIFKAIIFILFIQHKFLPTVSAQVANIQIGEGGPSMSLGLEIIIIITLLVLAPSILLMMTTFPRILIIFHFLRQASGTQNMPPNQIVIGISLFLTFFIMWPVGLRIHENAIIPLQEEEIDYTDAFLLGFEELRLFMLKQTTEKDLALFVRISRLERPASRDDLPSYIIIPAFILNELRIAFQIGFMIFIPFLIIDLVIASVLLSMGMMMLPPVMISLPFKILLFVLIDGWGLIIESISRSFIR